MGMQVQFLAWLSGVGIRVAARCHEGQRCSSDLAWLWRSSDLTPSPELPYTTGVAIFKKGVPIVAKRKQIWLGIMRLQVGSLASISGLRIRCCRELCRSKMWLGSCCGCGVAVALIWPQAWEPPYVVGLALKSKKKKKSRNRILCCYS